jgi:hypothetical protein
MMMMMTMMMMMMRSQNYTAISVWAFNRVGGVWLGSVMKKAESDCYRDFLAVTRLERMASALPVEGGPSPPHMREKSDSLDSQD